MSRNASKIATDLAVDPALTQGPMFQLDANDRQYLDNQIRGIQQHLVAGLIRGRLASWYRLDGASATVAAGDCVCSAASPSASDPTVTKAVAVALANVTAGVGVVILGGAPGSWVLVALGGSLLPPTITALGATKGYVRINTTTAKCERVASLSGSDFGIGSVDSGGWMLVSGFVLTASGAVVGDGNALTVPYRTSTIDTTLVRAVDYILEFTASGKTATLPASPVTGDGFIVRAPQGGSATVAGSGGLQIDGASSYTTVVLGEAIELRFNGTQWRKF